MAGGNGDDVGTLWTDAVTVGSGDETGGEGGDAADGAGNGDGGDDFTFAIPEPGRRKRAPRGTASPGTRKPRSRQARASNLDIDGLGALLFSLHYGLFAQRLPKMVLSPDESKELATGIANLARHFPDLPISPWAIDAAFLAGTAAKIYIPRLLPGVGGGMFGNPDVIEG